jgi:hypothetical protein
LNTSIRPSALRVGNADDATSVLVALSEPLSLLGGRNGRKVLGEESRVVGARLWSVSACASSSIGGRSGNVDGASVVVVANVEVLADSL